jgi:FkbM family methyltransferase
MNKLIEFCLDTENPEKNYRLAQWYEEQGHTGPAHTYYLRAAERSEDKNLSYMSLLRSAICCKKQQTREVTEKSLIDSALVLLPERPEAYYLLCLFYEKKQDWQNCYLYASLGLSCYKNELEDIDIPEYKGKYLLIYQKAISSWWWGKGEETRNLYRELVFEHWDEMNDWYKKEVENKMMCLGISSESQSNKPYDKNRYNELRFKFKNSEKIENNYSQVFQDIFVLSMLNGKENGTFLEIGGARPFERNNTALLEKQFGWKGVSIENNVSFANEYKKERPSTIVLCNDALTIDYNKLLTEYYDETIIDYLQLDIEPAKNTYDCMLKIPFDKYKFAVITYEHDYYIDRTQSYREKSRKFLQEKGYVLVANDISPEGKSNFEDWWVHPDLIDENILNTMSSVNDETKHIEDYILCNKFYSEFETDKYIRDNFFPDLDYKGIMVEVGAGPEEFISNSKHFRNYGWRTIAVEPNPKFVKQHEDNNSEVYQYACSNEEKDTTFTINYNNDNWYSKDNDGVSFSSLKIRYDGVPEHNTQETIDVQTIKLDTLLKKINVDKVDILSIDTEGWELEVMMGFDEEKYNPKVIILENFENNSKYETFMNEKNYVKHSQLGYNEIYLKNNQNYYDVSKDEKNNETWEKYKLVPKVIKTEEINTPTSKFSFLNNNKNTAWIVDNFYDNPDEIRKFALEQEFGDESVITGFVGRRTFNQFLFPGLKEAFESIMGKKITKWEEHGMNGRFQICWSGERLVYHCDSQKWGGMLYLSPNAPYQCGTTLYADKKNRARTYYDPGWDDYWANTPGDCHLDRTPFEPVDVLGNVYNRLVIFDASCIHSASEYFGTNKENARLWQMFFFDTES